MSERDEREDREDCLWRFECYEEDEPPLEWIDPELSGPELEEVLGLLREASRMADMAIASDGPRHRELAEFAVEIYRQTALSWCVEFKCSGWLRDLLKRALKWARESSDKELEAQIRKVIRLSEELCIDWECGWTEEGKEGWDEIMVAMIKP